jgi:hypothetical protein
MPGATSSVLIIDDDAEFRDSVGRLCSRSAWTPANFRLFPNF